MPESLEYTVSADELEQTIQGRLRGRASTPAIVWASGDEELELATVAARLRVVPGWLAMSVPVSARLRGARELHDTLGVVIHLGAPGEGAGPGASATVARSREPDLAQRWGPEVLRIVWESVLHTLDVAVRAYGPAARLRGFTAGADQLVVDVEVAE